MKKAILLFLGVLVVGCQNQQKQAKDQLLVQEQLQVEFAKNISDKLLSSQKAGGYHKLNEEEATQSMIDGLNKAVQIESYKKIKRAFGDYESLEIDTVFQIKEDQPYHVFRFRGRFEANEKVEVRTVLDLKGKLAGFFVLPWKEEF